MLRLRPVSRVASSFHAPCVAWRRQKTRMTAPAIKPSKRASRMAGPFEGRRAWAGGGGEREAMGLISFHHKSSLPVRIHYSGTLKSLFFTTCGVSSWSALGNRIQPALRAA